MLRALDEDWVDSSASYMEFGRVLAALRTRFLHALTLQPWDRDQLARMVLKHGKTEDQAEKWEQLCLQQYAQEIEEEQKKVQAITQNEKH